MHLLEPGTDRWINGAQYPLISSYTRWHLSAGGALSSAFQATEGNESLAWGDPAQPGARIAFTTAPIAEGATLAGPISATLYASSSNTNLEIIARLYDVAPDGGTTLVSRGAILGSQRALDPAKSWRDA